MALDAPFGPIPATPPPRLPISALCSRPHHDPPVRPAINLASDMTSSLPHLLSARGTTTTIDKRFPRPLTRGHAARPVPCRPTVPRNPAQLDPPHANIHLQTIAHADCRSCSPSHPLSSLAQRSSAHIKRSRTRGGARVQFL
jgi:hypothetical protein